MTSIEIENFSQSPKAVPPWIEKRGADSWFSMEKGPQALGFPGKPPKISAN